jgi:peptidoglycan/LPS O-acetylase OafA/YrhL
MSNQPFLLRERSRWMELEMLEPIPAEQKHEPQLDGVRGIAILAVLLAHAVNFLDVVPLKVPQPLWARVFAKICLQGWGGVDLFFVLSGFLITGILLRSRGRSTYFSSFYMRRILRIFPVYYLFLTVTLLLAYHTRLRELDLEHRMNWWLPYFFYVQNWPVFWTNWVGMTSLWGAYWSLAVEEQFYMVWPTIVRFIPVRWVLALCVCGFLLGVPERQFLIRHVGPKLGVLQWPFSRLDGLFLGAAIALYANWRKRPVPLRWARAAMGVAVLIFIWILVRHPGELMGGGSRIWAWGVTAFALAAAALVTATQHNLRWLAPVLMAKPLRIAGRLSYGMYVYHLLVFRFITVFLEKHLHRVVVSPRPWTAAATIAVSIALVTLVAEASYRWFEMPFLRLKRFFPSAGRS